ncbi:unnamed protein product [Anisakis simplex]|uniref:VWFA domain-containing protein n=1 Tax=Anisakis simplex TaxID=6269 RepID=A0A3P6RDT3_ANISI|nr:unnamed protein product [Anisakis simplex]
MMFFERQGRNIRMLDADASLVTDITLPEGSRIQNVLPVNPYTHLIELRDRYALMSFEEDGRCLLRAVDTPTNIPKNLLCSRNVEIASNKQPLHIIASDQYYAITSNGFPMTFSAGEVNVSKREQDSSHDDVHSNKPYQYAHPHLNSLILDSGHIVRAMPHWRIPAKAIHEDISPDDYVGVLEIVDPLNENDSISSALNAWEKLFGDQTDESLRLEFGKDDFDMSKLDDPKIGKVDPANTPHVGGSTWAGGTGGYNTAGLGGVGGPFRLDAGHDVHQLPQNAKDAVPEHIRRKAREIAKSEYKKRLHEIDMSEHDAKMYNALYGRIEKQSRILRSVIDSLEAKAKERQWIRHQTNGDLDDAKLVEGITGERTIYRRRIDQKPDESAEQNKPKRIRFCFDVSGSMYRFNGYDQRLQRSLESALLVMESLHGKHSKIIYDIVGHSGESEKVSFVKLNNSPSNENSRLKVLKKMLLHSQFCMSGDSTLECMQLSADEISKEDSDERFVVVVSDANFDRFLLFYKTS